MNDNPAPIIDESRSDERAPVLAMGLFGRRSAAPAGKDASAKNAPGRTARALFGRPQAA